MISDVLKQLNIGHIIEIFLVISHIIEIFLVIYQTSMREFMEEIWYYSITIKLRLIFQYWVIQFLSNCFF